jgi:hypothetical protein
MTQDNIPQDTPQEGVNTEQYSSLEEAVFGDTSNEGSSNISDVFTIGNEGTTEQAPEQGQPQVSEGENNQPIQEQSQPEVTDNDTKRYQYWQSQADKFKNELDAVRRNEPQGLPAQQQIQEEVPQNPVEEFPPPPDRPKRPGRFSREEAYSDPSSESSRYLDAKEEWDEQMVEYNTLRNQYNTALVQERFDKMESQRVNEAKRQQASLEAQKQQNDIKSYVTGHHGMNDNEANDFMTKMSDPASINIDNLVQLYRMQSGGPANQANPPTPSQTFQQTRNAQQVPSPMGVMPSGQSNSDTTSFEDKVMDRMIGNFNSKNPWK